MTLLCAWGLAACAGGPGLPKIALPDLSKAQLPAVAIAPGEVQRASVGATETYRRIAAGANRCWFAPASGLRQTHLLQAEAPPEVQSAPIFVAIHERATTGPTVWGPRAYLIELTPIGEQTSIEAQNLRLPDATATTVREDISEWVEGGQGCRTAVPLPEPASAPVIATPAKTKRPARPTVRRPAPTATSGVAGAAPPAVSAPKVGEAAPHAANVAVAPAPTAASAAASARDPLVAAPKATEATRPAAAPPVAVPGMSVSVPGMAVSTR